MPAALKECAPSVHEVFNNKTSRFRRLVTWVKAQSESAPIDSWLFCGENTGGYSIGLSNYLYASAYDMWLECAYKIKHSVGIQRVKNDKTDSKAIAEYAMRNYDKMILYKPQSASLTCLREVFLYRHSLVRQRVSLQVRRDEKRLTQEKTDIRAFMSFTSKHLITEVNKAIAKCDQKIKDIIAADDELKEIFDIITSIPGIGIQNATCLMVYTDNFQKSMLSQAALVAIKFDVNVYNYYQRLKERGKHPLLIHNNIKNKMLHAFVAMVRDRVKYNPDHVYQTNKEIAYSAKC